MLNRLDRGVIVVLMDLSVDHSLTLFLLSASDSLMLNGGIDDLMHGCVMLPIFGEKVLNSCLRLVHFE